MIFSSKRLNSVRLRKKIVRVKY